MDEKDDEFLLENQYVPLCLVDARSSADVRDSADAFLPWEEFLLEETDEERLLESNYVPPCFVDALVDARISADARSSEDARLP